MVVDDDKERRWGRLVVWGPFSPIGDADLDRVEQAVGSALPEAYRAFMKVAHGGTLQYAVRLPPGDPNGDFVELSEMFTVTGDGWGSLVGEWASHPATYMAEQLPAGLLPVARGGNDLLYLDLRASTFGDVWAFVHGRPDWAGGDGRDRGGRVCGSWDEYLDRLVVTDSMAQEIWQDAKEGAEPGWLPSVVHWLDAGRPGWRWSAWAADG